MNWDGLKKPRTWYILLALGVALHELFFAHTPYRIWTVNVPLNTDHKDRGPQFFVANLTALKFVWWFANYFFTAWLGAMIVGSLGLRRSLPMRLGAGFFLGYLATCAMARIWASFTSDAVFYGLTVVSILTVSFWLRRRSPPAAKAQESPWPFVVGLFVFVGSALLMVHFGDFHFVGHGLFQYSFHMPEFDHGLFPIINQHYDEFIYHHFLSAPLFAQGSDPLIPWWITLALNKASVFLFLVVATESFGLSATRSLALAVFMFFGTLSLWPLSYDLMYDSANPFFFVAHSGRLVGPPAFLFFLLAWRAPKLETLLGIALVAAGLTATSISNTLWLFALLALGAAAPWLKIVATKMSRWAYRGLGLSIFLYFQPALLWLIWAKLVLLVIYFIHGLKDMVRRRVGTFAPLAVRLFSVVGGVSLVYLLFFGNIAANMAPARALRAMVSQSIAELPYGDIAPKVLTNVAEEGGLIGNHMERENYTYYCHSIYSLVLIYGGVFLLLIFGLKILERTLDKQDAKMALVFYSMAILLPAVFFLVEFVGFGGRAFVRTRFLEIPVNTIIFLSAVMIWPYFSKVQGKAFTLYLWSYSLLPFLFTLRPVQIYKNAEFLLQIIGGG